MSEQKEFITENKHENSITNFNEKRESVRIDLDIYKDLMRMLDWYRHEHNEIRDFIIWYKEFNK